MRTVANKVQPTNNLEKEAPRNYAKYLSTIYFPRGRWAEKLGFCKNPYRVILRSTLPIIFAKEELAC